MPARLDLDDADLAILGLLGENARRPVTDIASRVNLTPAPVRRRIERLERQGVIRGYTLVLDRENLDGPVEAFTELRFAGTTDFEHIVSTASAIPEVQEVFTIAGDLDALVRIRVRDVEHLKRVVNGLRRSQYVTGTKTLMVLDSWRRTS